MSTPVFSVGFDARKGHRQPGSSRAEHRLDAPWRGRVLRPTSGEAAIDQHQTGDPARVARGQRHRHETTHGMARHDDLLATHRVKHRDEISDVGRKAVRATQWCATAAAPQVRCEEGELGQLLSDCRPGQIRCGDAVQGEHRRTAIAPAADV